MDTKKYIIEIPDNTAWLQWIKVSDKDGHVCFDFKDPEDLTLYTEPNLDAVRNEAYEKGVQDTKQHWVDAPRTCAYKLGYENGLNDAWDAARKIPLNVNEGGLSANALTMMFGNKSIIQIFKEFSASEVTEKIRQYEQEEIRVGDEVEAVSGKAVIIEVLNNGKDVRYMYSDTSTGFNNSCNITRTGRHFPEIAEVLRKMKEEES